MFENSPIIKDHSRPAVKLAASGIFVGLCEILAKNNADYVKFQALFDTNYVKSVIFAIEIHERSHG